MAKQLRNRRRGRRGGRRHARRGRLTRPLGKNVVEFASAKQVLELTDDMVNQILIMDNVNLSLFDRLSQIARCYQYFRFTKIEMKFKPYWDTFISTGGPGSTGTVPYLHYLIDKGEVLLPNAGLGFNQLRDAGAKPIRFDEKTITVSWAPKVLGVVAGSDGPLPNLAYQAPSRNSPWLSTNNAGGQDPVGWVPSMVPHKGLYYGVEQAIPNTNLIYGVEITVYAQFKKPLAFSAVQDGPAPVQKSMVPKDAQQTTATPA